MSAAVAKTLLQRTGEHPVVSLYFDLDPSEFATAPARATQARSLLDAARNLLDADGSLGHDAVQAVRSDLQRLDGWLGSDDLPVSGAAGLAVFACGEADVFETVVLGAPVASAVYLERAPHVEPLVTQPASAKWAAVVVTRDDARIWFGHGTEVDAHEESRAYVRGHSASVQTTGRDNPHDVSEHLAQVAAGLDADLRGGRFTTLLIGGPVEARSGLEARLSHDVRAALDAAQLDVDGSSASDSDVAAAASSAVAASAERSSGELLSRFSDGLDGGGRAVAGISDVLDALGERRVDTLLLARDFHAAGTRCTRCGRLGTAETSTCPVDGSPTAAVPDLREPMIAEAVRQDAAVFAASDPVDELPASRPVGALLRF